MSAPLLAGVAVVAAVLLVVLVVSLVRGLHADRPLAELPVVPEQEIVVEAAGPLLLHVEGPQLTTRFQGLEYALVRGDGEPVPASPVWWREVRASLSRARVSVRTFAVGARGVHRLRVTGLRPDVDYRDCRLVLTPDRRVASGLWLGAHVVGLILAGAGLLVSTILITVGRGREARPPAAASAPAGADVLARRAGGRSLAAATSTDGWRTVAWPALGMRARVPPDWTREAIDERELRVGAGDDGASLHAHVTDAPTGLTREALVDAHLRAARGRLGQGAIEGFAGRTLGQAPGALSFGTERGQPALLWEGFVGPDDDRLRAVTLRLWGPEPVLAAVLASVEFP